MARNEPDPSDWEGHPPISSGADGEIEWSVVGYIPIGETYEGLHNFDPDSTDKDRQRFPVEQFPDSWDFLGEADLLYVRSVSSTGDVTFTIVAGPFTHWDQLADAVDDWWEQGS